MVKLTEMKIEVESGEGNADADNDAQAKERLRSVIGQEEYDKIAAMVAENVAAASDREEEDGSEKIKVQRPT